MMPAGIRSGNVVGSCMVSALLLILVATIPGMARLVFMETTTNGATNTTEILMSEGVCFRQGWRQYFVVTAGRIAIVHMVPAVLGGWRFDRVEVQGESEWGKRTAAEIVAWKMRSSPADYQIVTGTIDADFRGKLFAKAGVA